jgi:hypothetical protein
VLIVRQHILGIKIEPKPHMLLKMELRILKDEVKTMVTNLNGILVL